MRTPFLIALQAAVLASCRQAATPPQPTVTAPDAAAPEAAAPEATVRDAGSPPVDVVLDDAEWRAKIRTAATPCKVDEIRERFSLNGTSGTACPPDVPVDDNLVRRAKLDPIADNTGSFCHYSYCDAIKVKHVPRTPCHDPTPTRFTQCFAPPEQGTSVPAPPPYAKCAAGVIWSKMAGPFDPKSTKENEDGQCCYAFCAGRPVPGRPFRVESGLAVAGARDGTAWLGEIGDFHPAHDAVLADRWLREAALEHASVAAFARLSLELLAHGAPPELVSLTHAAAVDEIAHAQTCFAFAHAHGATACAPRREPAFTLPRAPSLRELAIETFLDGCIGETMASLLLHAEADAADGVQRALLLGMAEDEQRHAELGWAIVAWALTVDPSIEDAVTQTWKQHQRSAQWLEDSS